METSKVYIVVRDIVLIIGILFSLFSPHTDKSGVPYEAENADELVMSMSVVSDVHIEKLNPTSYQYFYDILKNIKAGKDIDAVAYLGDNVMNGQLLENFYFYSAVKLVNPSDNQYVLTGNHDLGNGERNYEASRMDFIANNKLYLGVDLEELYYYRIVNGCYIIALSSEDENAGAFHMSDAQIEWMKGVLEEAKAADAPIVVLSHFPVYEIAGEDSNGNPRDCRELAWILNKYDKLLYLYGHRHNELKADNFKEWNGVDIINLPRVTEYFEYEPGDGVVIEVYEDHFLVRGRDFVKGEWVDGLVYTYNF